MRPSRTSPEFNVTVSALAGDTSQARSTQAKIQSNCQSETPVSLVGTLLFRIGILSLRRFAKPSLPKSTNHARTKCGSAMARAFGWNLAQMEAIDKRLRLATARAVGWWRRYDLHGCTGRRTYALVRRGQSSTVCGDCAASFGLVRLSSARLTRSSIASLVPADRPAAKS